MTSTDARFSRIEFCQGAYSVRRRLDYRNRAFAVVVDTPGGLRELVHCRDLATAVSCVRWHAGLSKEH